MEPRLKTVFSRYQRTACVQNAIHKFTVIITPYPSAQKQHRCENACLLDRNNNVNIQAETVHTGVGKGCRGPIKSSASRYFFRIVFGNNCFMLGLMPTYALQMPLYSTSQNPSYLAGLDGGCNTKYHTPERAHART